MSGTKLFIDTNIILYLLDGDETLADFLQNKQLYILVITEMELLGYKGITAKEEKQIKSFVEECKTVNINNTIKDDTIRIRKTYGNKLPDSIIAATAIYLDTPFVTTDTDFKRIEELELIQYEKQ